MRAVAVAAALLLAAGQAYLAARPAAAADERPPAPLPHLAPKPEYPLESRRRREEGAVRVALRVDREGAVRHIDILRSSGSPALDTAALVALANWRFSPATRDGEPVPGRVVTTIRFRIGPPPGDAPPGPGPGAPRRPPRPA